MIAALMPWRWIAGALALFALAGAVWWHGDQHGKAVIQAAWNAERAAVATAGATAQRQVDQKHETQEAAVGASDTFRTQELSHETAEIDTHRAPVASGAERVRIVSAVCPARSSDLPQPAPSVGKVDAAPVELAPAVGQLVLDLKAAITADREKIKALQDYVRAIGGAPTDTGNDTQVVPVAQPAIARP